MYKRLELWGEHEKANVVSDNIIISSWPKFHVDMTVPPKLQKNIVNEGFG